MIIKISQDFVLSQPIGKRNVIGRAELFDSERMIRMIREKGRRRKRRRRRRGCDIIVAVAFDQPTGTNSAKNEIMIIILCISNFGKWNINETMNKDMNVSVLHWNFFASFLVRQSVSSAQHASAIYSIVIFTGNLLMISKEHSKY